MTILSYRSAMGEEGAHIRLRLSTESPISLTDFVSNFVGIGNQFEKFVAREYPNHKADSEIFVKEVRDGSIEADLVAWVLGGGALATAMVAIDGIDKVQILARFVGDLGKRLGKYFRPGGRDETASKGDLSDFLKTIQAVAHDDDGSARLEAAVFEDGKREVRAAFRFTTEEGRAAEKEIEAHRRELETSTAADHERVLMRFVRPSIEPTKSHKKTGERVVIEAIQAKPLAVVYASDLARERIRDAMTQPENNIFRLIFDVDVNVEMIGGRAVAYRIVAVHDVTDIPDDED